METIVFFIGYVFIAVTSALGITILLALAWVGVKSITGGIEITDKKLDTAPDKSIILHVAIPHVDSTHETN